jgi:hypothetical protein
MKFVDIVAAVSVNKSMIRKIGEQGISNRGREAMYIQK